MISGKVGPVMEWFRVVLMSGSEKRNVWMKPKTSTNTSAWHNAKVQMGPEAWGRGSAELVSTRVLLGSPDDFWILEHSRVLKHLLHSLTY